MSRGALILAVVLGAQFVLLLLIYSNTGADSKGLENNRFPASVNSNPNPPARSNRLIEIESGDQSITEDRLRQIIQEELRSHMRDVDLTSAQRDTQPAAGQDVDAAELATRRAFVLGQLDYYSSVGSISSAEMAQLHRSIAKLDEVGRTEMLSRLNRALNSGQLTADF